MKYDSIPRPTIESHYHIRDLIEAQEKRAEDRTYHRDKAKALEERMNDIKNAKPLELKAFWCETCKLDFLAETVKEVEIDWSCPTQYIAFYRTKCFKGHWCQRLITDVHKDHYWFKSRKVSRDQGEHSLDTVQPYETNYELLYSNKRK